jgi:hypothetical protein
MKMELSMFQREMMSDDSLSLPEGVDDKQEPLAEAEDPIVTTRRGRPIRRPKRYMKASHGFNKDNSYTYGKNRK